MVMTQRKYEYGEAYSYPENLSYELPSLPVRSRRKAAKPQRSVNYGTAMKRLMAALLIIGMFGVVAFQTIDTTIIKNAEVRQLEKELENLTKENNLLQIEVDRLSSVARIEQAALAMGMEKPTGRMYVANSLIQPSNTTEVEPSSPLAEMEPEKPAGTFRQFIKMFTSFFASTQG